MIAAGDPQEFVPFGRNHLLLHPGDIYLPTLNRTVAGTDASILKALQGVSLKESDQKEWWKLQEYNNSEEELYVSKRTAVWSRTNGCGVSNMHKVFTVESTIQQALWCNTFCKDLQPRSLSFELKEPKEGANISSVCVLESSRLQVFCLDGHIFTCALLFEATKVFPCKYGVLVERKQAFSEKDTIKREPFPLLFSVLHPLDDVSPVYVHSNTSKLGYFVDPNEEVVFTSADPSIVITYNRADGVHNVWKLRLTTAEEVEFCSTVGDASLLTSTSWAATPGSRTAAVSNLSRQPTFSPKSSVGSPKCRSFGRISSPALMRTQSPRSSSRTHMATLSRCQSPTVSATHFGRSHFGLTPTSGTPKLLGTPFRADTPDDFSVPLIPDICLEHVWMEQIPCTEKASKIFLTTDICGQQFICFFLKELRSLRFVKVEESNDRQRLIFGHATAIYAKDAEPILPLKMILVLDENNSLILFTGLLKVCKVYVPRILTATDSVPRSFKRLCRSGTFDIHGPRRSSMIPTSKVQQPSFDDELRFLSPVPTVRDVPVDDSSYLEDNSFGLIGTLVGIRDSVSYHVNLETSNGDIFRISLPKMSSSDIVFRLLHSLQCVLPKDVAAQLLIKWYCVRNAPGPSDLTAPAELNAFLLCLMGILGFNVETVMLDGVGDCDWLVSPVALKKPKPSDEGSDEDWQYLLTSLPQKRIAKERMMLGLENLEALVSSESEKECASPVNTTASLFSYLPSILYTLHLFYEECKLHTLMWEVLPVLARVLHQMSRTLNLTLYRDFYWRDFPEFCGMLSVSSEVLSEVRSWHCPSYFSPDPPSIFNWLLACLQDEEVTPFPYIPHVTFALRNMVLLFSLMSENGNTPSLQWDKYLHRILPPGHRAVDDVEALLKKLTGYSAHSRNEQIASFLSDLGYTNEDLEYVPLGVLLPLQEAIHNCRQNPPSNWPARTYSLCRRHELIALTSEEKPFLSNVSTKKLPTKDEDDGIEHLDQDMLKLKFSKDLRIQEVYRMLQSSKPVCIALQQRPEISDHEFIEEQERQLYTICIRTMALAVGRGMLTLETCHPLVTETLPIPKLCLTGKASPRNTTVDLSHIDVPPNMNMWPLFHNGVAAGLRIAPHASEIDSTWITYNKPRSNNSTDSPTEHAGFLMALGLNGHLINLSPMNVHDYLSKGHELSSVGILIGFAVSRLGSMDVATTRTLSLHLEALLPPTATELDIPPVVQVAAILGVGLLYQGSAHRHMAEVLLGEIGRPPGPEMEHSVDRESYALAAGLALGLVTLGRGPDIASLSDLPMADQLYHYMVGGHKRPLMGIHKEKQKSPSYQIREGDMVNVDVTSPGATLALGMMFFNTSNRAIAEWMDAPDTQYLLDMVRPDFLMLRMISSSLIMWQEIFPTRNWVESHIPEIVANNALKKGQNSSDIDQETMSQAYCNIIAGLCMSLGLKFAGSANEEAFDTLLYYARMFLSISGKSVAEQAGKSTIETCLNVSVLSLAMVMAGTGDLEVLRICRHLRSRISQTPSYVQYGSHMATHMALGLLFLGGGRFTLKTTPEAVGAMLCAFFPKFPTHSNDNRYHLQAFRHLYVLAAEPRLIIPRDIVTGHAVYAHLHITFKDTSKFSGEHYVVKAPCLLPELDLLQEVSVEDSRYWPVRFDHRQNWSLLKDLLHKDGNLYVKQKVGCLPYTEDPKGFHSVLAQHFIKDSIRGWTVKPSTVVVFSCDSLVLHFANCFLLPRAKTKKEGELQQHLCGLLFECATQEKTEALMTYLYIGNWLSNKFLPDTLNLSQLKLIFQYHRRKSPKLLNRDFVFAIKSLLEETLDHQTTGDWCRHLASYIAGKRESLPSSLPAFLTFYGVPSGEKLNLDSKRGPAHVYEQLQRLKIPVTAIVSLMSRLFADR